MTTTREAQVRLVAMKEGRRPSDYRTPPGGPLRLGDRVVLCYHTEHGRGPNWPFEYLSADVTEDAGHGYRGRIIHDAFPPLLPPEKRFAEGDTITFQAEHIVDI